MAAPAPSHQPQQLWWQQGPLGAVSHLQRSLQRFGDDLQLQGQHFGDELQRRSGRTHLRLASVSAPTAAAPAPLPMASSRAAANKPVDKEEVGRCTWVFLHTLAAQLPEKPTRQQQRDVRSIIDSLTRVYPCGECAQHFAAIVK